MRITTLRARHAAMARQCSVWRLTRWRTTCRLERTVDRCSSWTASSSVLSLLVGTADMVLFSFLLFCHFRFFIRNDETDNQATPSLSHSPILSYTEIMALLLFIFIIILFTEFFSFVAIVFFYGNKMFLDNIYKLIYSLVDDVRLCGVLGVKLLLYVICRRVPNPICRALANDHRNDVISNTAAVACGIIGELPFFVSLKRKKL